MEEDLTSQFDFEWQSSIDDELKELENYVFGKVTTVDENNILRRHAGDPTEETSQQLRQIAARYQRGELGILLPVLIPFAGGDQKRMATDFFATIEEQDDENVSHMYRLAKVWASDLGFKMPDDAPPIDERPMDLIEIERPWPEMSSIAVH
ncbi:hypothetical protein V6R85_24170 [Agrobacterium sp. CCNWLW32]|uniref:hypothetical protein n=1 Tax=Agrobacterium sp. CCNWLW32 TaxID=3122072 RepID=UPI00300F8B4C